MMNKVSQSSMISTRSRGAFEIALLYLLIGILWIVFSDEAAAVLAPNQAALTQISIYKGWGYVLVTALLLYWMIRRHTQKVSQAKLTLNESEKNYQELLQQASDGIFIADAQGQYTLVNEEACRLLGYTKEELLSMNLRELIAPEDIQKTPPRLDELKNGKTLLSERKLLRKDGSRILCEISAKQFPDGRYQSIIRDITERKMTDEALLRSEQRYRSLFENMTNGFSRCQMIYENGAPTDFVYLDINEAFKQLTGLQDVIGKRVSAVIPGIRESNPELFEIYGRVAITGNPEKFETHVPGLRSGVWFSVSVYSTEKNFFVAVFEAITERKLAEAALRENEERLRLSLHAANQGLYDLNVQTGNAIVNREYAEMLGYDFASFVETNAAWIERLHPDDQELTANAYADYIKGLTSEYRVEFRQKTKAGDWKWILSLGKVVEYDAAGKPLRMLGTHTDITVRKQAEVKLRNSEEQYRLMFTNNPLPIFVFDRQTFVFLAVNDATIEHYGYSREEFLQMTIKDIRLPEDIPAMLNIVAAESTPYYNIGVVKHRKKDGTLIDVEITRHDILFDGHEALIVLINDITERKQIEEELKASEFRFRLAAESLTDVIYEWDIKEKVDWFGDVDALMGYAPGTFPRTLTGWAALLHPDDRERVLAAVDAQLKGAAAYNIEYRVATKHGEWRWWSARGVAIRDPQGEPYHWIGSISDITERMQQDKALKKSEAKYRTLHESMIDGFVSVDMHGNFLECNEVYRNMLGYSDAELATLTYVDITPENWHAYEAEVVENQILKRGFSDIYEKEYRRKDDTIFPVELHTVLLRDEAGMPSGMWAIVRDITERKRVETTLAHERELLRTLVDNLPQEVYVKDRERCFLLVNELVMQALGAQNMNQVLGKRDEDFMPSDLAKQFANEEEEIMRTGVPMLNDEHTPPYRLGPKQWYLRTKIPLRDNTGKVVGLVGMGQDITERKQAEFALQAAEYKYRMLAENSPDIIYIINLKTFKTTYLNRPTLLGYTLDELEASGSIMSKVHPDDVSALQIHWQNVLNGTSKDTVIYRLQLKDGSWEWLSSRENFLARDEHGNPAQILVTLSVITKRKQVEAQIEYQARLLENVSEAIIATDENQMITAWNSGAENLYGWNAAEVIGKPARQIIRSDFSETQRAEAIKSLTETGDFKTEVIQYHRNGQMFWTEGHTISIRDETGKVTGFVAINRDITDRKQAAEALQRSQENFAKAFISNPAAIAITRLVDGKFININPAYTRIMEYEPNELLGRTPAEMNIYVHAEDRAQLIRQLREQGTIQNYELLVRIKSGETRSIVISMEPLLYNAEECILTVFIDISERKKMEMELQRSNAELEQFAYVASHDLQEPLRAVAGMVQLLQQRYQGKLDERADEYIDHAVEASTRMQTLINDLLDYSRVNRLGRVFESTAVEKSLNAALANLQLAIQESQAQITHDPLPTLMADAVQLTQLLQNLIGNAIKFRGVRPLHIHLGAKKIEQAWQFSVSDNGIGIEPKYYERIFLVFQRLHTRREYPGTGIGLALCKKIIERHGGQIWVESQPGLGSTFYFTIPERQP